MNNAEFAYNELVNRHQEFTELIEDEVEFEREEEWLDESREAFLQLKMDASDYVNRSHHHHHCRSTRAWRSKRNFVRKSN